MLNATFLIVILVASYLIWGPIGLLIAGLVLFALPLLLFLAIFFRTWLHIGGDR